MRIVLKNRWACHRITPCIVFPSGLVALFGAVSLLGQGVAAQDVLPQVTLAGTHARTLHSTTVGEDYQLSVWLPPSYHSSSFAYPVVYVLDANIAFGIAANMTDLLSFAREIPEVIVVGIGYEGNWTASRTRDLTPSIDVGWPGSGGADNFLAFLENELLPFIDASYRTDPKDRSLWGYSLGGLFVLYTLLNEPELFQRYVAGSPFVGWDFNLIADQEKSFFETQASLPGVLIITVGSEEHTFMPGYRSNIESFATALQERNYDGLQLELLLLEDETHFSGTARSYVTGLKAAFSHRLSPAEP